MPEGDIFSPPFLYFVYIVINISKPEYKKSANSIFFEGNQHYGHFCYYFIIARERFVWGHLLIIEFMHLDIFPNT